MIFPDSKETLNNLINDSECHFRSGNNNIYIINKENNKYIIKKYFNEKERLKREIYFLNYLKKIKYKNCPELIYFSEKLNYSVLSYINAKPFDEINKPKQNAIFAYQNFLNAINTKSIAKYNKNAKDFSFEIKGHISNIKKRITLYAHESKNFKKDVSHLLSNVNQEFDLLVNKHKKDIILNSYSVKPVLSPSDVGFHNMLHNRNNFFFY